MSFEGLNLDVNSQLGVGVRVEAGAMAAAIENVTIEDQVTDLFDKLRGSIYSYLVAVFGRNSSLDADDITQESFLQLHRMLQKGHTIDNPRAYLFRIAHNTALARIKTTQFIAPLDDLAWDDLCQRVPDPAATPEQRTQRLEEFERIFDGIKRLSFQERQCLYLRAEGLRYKEIGDILEISVPSVGKYLKRAIHKLMPASNGEIHTTGQ